MYDLDTTETSKGALVELCRALRQYRNDMVLAGGWAPYFLVKDFFDHCGSVDIDFVLKPTVIERYENIKQILERLGYRSTGSVFRFEREVTSPRSDANHRVEVDFLTEPEGADRLSGDWLASVQQDLKACIIEGCSVVFRHNSVLGRCEPPNSLKSGSSMSQENTMMAARFSESDDENTLPKAKRIT